MAFPGVALVRLAAALASFLVAPTGSCLADDSRTPPVSRRETRQFDIVARRYTTESEVRRRARFVLLVSGPAAEVASPERIHIDPERLRPLAVEALVSAGYTPAERAADAEIAVAIGYGRGEYRPPFEFMGIDPRVIPHHMWPALLKIYDESYRRLSYENADITGFAEQRAAAPGELFNVLVIRAFDAEELRRRRSWRLLWETRVTIGATEGLLENLLPGMLVAARGGLGGDDPAGAAVRLPMPSTKVEVGEAVVVEPHRAAERPAIQESAKPAPED